MYPIRSAPAPGLWELPMSPTKIRTERTSIVVTERDPTRSERDNNN